MLNLYIDARVRTLFDLVDNELTFSHAIFRDYLAANEIADQLQEEYSTKTDKASEIIFPPTVLDLIQHKFRPKRLIKTENTTPQQPDFKLENGWSWIPSGLSICTDKDSYDGYVESYVTVAFPKGFWISSTLITVQDLYEIQKLSLRQDLDEVISGLTRFVAVKPEKAPLVDITYDEANALAESIMKRVASIMKSIMKRVASMYLLYNNSNMKYIEHSRMGTGLTLHTHKIMEQTDRRSRMKGAHSHWPDH